MARSDNVMSDEDFDSFLNSPSQTKEASSDVMSDDDFDSFLNNSSAPPASTDVQVGLEQPAPEPEAPAPASGGDTGEVVQMSSRKPGPQAVSATAGKEGKAEQVAPNLFMNGDSLFDSDRRTVKPGQFVTLSRKDGTSQLLSFEGASKDGKPVFKEVKGVSTAGADMAGEINISEDDYNRMFDAGNAKADRPFWEQVRHDALADTGDAYRYTDDARGTFNAFYDYLMPFLGGSAKKENEERTRILSDIREGRLDGYDGKDEAEKLRDAARKAKLEPWNPLESLHPGESDKDFAQRIRQEAEDELKLGAAAKGRAEQARQQTEATVGDKILKGGVESGAFALQFAIPGSIMFKGLSSMGMGAKAVRALTTLGSAIPATIAEADKRYSENITPEYSWKQTSLDGEPEFGMVAAPDAPGEAAYKAIGGAVFDSVVEVGLESATMGLLRLAGKPAGWLLGKATPGAVKEWGAKKFNRFMASETGQALRQINRAYQDFTGMTQINSPFGEMAEENVQALEKVLNLDGKTSEYKGLQKEWNEFYDRQFNADTQWDIFYGLIAQLGLGAAKSTAEGVSRHISEADVRRDVRMALARAGISEATLKTLTPEQQKKLDGLWRQYSADPDALKENVKDLGISMRLAVDELTAREGLKMRQTLEQRGIAPERFTIQTGADGKPAFQKMTRFTPDGKKAPMNAMTDAAHGVTIVDQGDGNFYVMNDFRGLDAIPASSFEDAQRKADAEVVRNQSMDADNEQKAQYLMGLVQRQYAGRNVVSIPSEAALRWQVAQAVRDGRPLYGITRADQLFYEDGSLRQPGAGGFHAPDGHIVVILDNVPSPAEMERVLAHEATGHEGVESATGRGARTVEFIQNAQAEGFSRFVEGERQRAIQRRVAKGMDEATATAQVDAAMATDEYKRESMARYAQGRLHAPTWYERRKHEANQRRRAAGENVPTDQADLEVMLAEQEAQGRAGDNELETLNADSGVRYEEGAADETGNGAAEAPAQPEQGEERGQEAPRPEAGAEPGAQAPDAGVVRPSNTVENLRDASDKASQALQDAESRLSKWLKDHPRQETEDGRVSYGNGGTVREFHELEAAVDAAREKSESAEAKYRKAQRAENAERQKSEEQKKLDAKKRRDEERKKWRDENPVTAQLEDLEKNVLLPAENELEDLLDSDASTNEQKAEAYRKVREARKVVDDFKNQHKEELEQEAANRKAIENANGESVEPSKSDKGGQNPNTAPEGRSVSADTIGGKPKPKPKGKRGDNELETLNADSGVRYEEGAADETGNGAAEAPAQPEQGEERGQEAPRPEAGAEPRAQAPDAGVVKPKTQGGESLRKINAERAEKRRQAQREIRALHEKFINGKQMNPASLFAFRDDGGRLLSMPPRKRTYDRKARKFRYQFVGDDPAVGALNRFFDGIKGDEYQLWMERIFGDKAKRRSTNTHGNDEVLADIMNFGRALRDEGMTLDEQMADERFNDFDGLLAGFAKEWADYERWKEDGALTDEERRLAELEAQDEELAQLASEEAEVLESYNLDELAAARDAMDEEFANALGVVEGADEADYATLTPASLQVAKSGDTIRFDHDRKSFVFGSFDAGSGVLVVYDEDVAGMEGGTFRRAYRVTENSIEEIDDGNGQGNEVRADADRAGDEKGSAGGGGQGQGGARGEETGTAATESSVKRRYTREPIAFSKPFVGKTGAKLVGYEWPNKGEEYVDKRGNDRVRRISDWDYSETNGETGRDIVHKFIVEMPDGERRTVSAESAAKLLGVSTSQVKGEGLKQIRKAMAAKSLTEAQRKAVSEAKDDARIFIDNDGIVHLFTEINRDFPITLFGFEHIAIDRKGRTEELEPKRSDKFSNKLIELDRADIVGENKPADFSLEAATPEQMAAEKERQEQREEIKKRQEAPLKGSGAVNVQSEMDLGQTGQQDLFSPIAEKPAVEADNDSFDFLKAIGDPNYITDWNRRHGVKESTDAEISAGLRKQIVENAQSRYDEYRNRVLNNSDAIDDSDFLRVVRNTKNVEEFIKGVRALIERHRAIRDDWAGRTYRTSNKKVDVADTSDAFSVAEGDTKRLSTDYINEHRRRNRVEREESEMSRLRESLEKVLGKQTLEDLETKYLPDKPNLTLESPIAENEETTPVAKEKAAERPAEYLAWLEKYKMKDTDGRFAEWQRKQSAQKPAKSAPASAPRAKGTTTPPEAAKPAEGGSVSAVPSAGKMADRFLSLVDKIADERKEGSKDESKAETDEEFSRLYNTNFNRQQAGWDALKAEIDALSADELFALQDALYSKANGFPGSRERAELRQQLREYVVNAWREKSNTASAENVASRVTSKNDADASNSDVAAPKGAKPAEAVAPAVASRATAKPAFKRGDRVFIKGAKNGQRVTFLKANADGTADVQVRTPGANRYAPEKVETRTVPMGDVSSTGMKDTLTGEERNAYRRGVAEQTKEAMRSDPVLRRIDAAYREAKTDAERNALKAQFAERVRALQGGVDFDTPELNTDYSSVPERLDHSLWWISTHDEQMRNDIAALRKVAERNIKAGADDTPSESEARSLRERINKANANARARKKLAEETSFEDIKKRYLNDEKYYREEAKELREELKRLEKEGIGDDREEVDWYTNGDLLEILDSIESGEASVSMHFDPYAIGRGESGPFAEALKNLAESGNFKGKDLERLNRVAQKINDAYKAIERDIEDPRGPFGESLASFDTPELSPVTPAEDAAYMDAVRRGDMETAERMVREAADRAGYGKIGFHGTTYKRGKFTTFQKGSHIGSEVYQALNRIGVETDGPMAKEQIDLIIEDLRRNGKDVLSLRVKLNNPLRISDFGDDWSGKDFVRRLYSEHPELFSNAEWAEMMKDPSRAHQMIEGKGYDGLVYDNGSEGILDYSGDTPGRYKADGTYIPNDSYIPFHPSQIKSADPVTYDDSGNVIPLSQRFNQQREDIRFDTPELTPAEAEYAAGEDKTPTEKVMREVYGMTNDEIATALRAAGMEPPAHVRKADADMWRQVETLLSNSTYIAKLSRAVAKFPRPTRDYENVALNVLFRQRQAAVNDLERRRAELAAIPEDDMNKKPELRDELKQVSAKLAQAKAQMAEAGKAAMMGASEQGRALRSNRALIGAHDYSYAGIAGRIAQTLGGIDKITPEMNARIRDLAKLFEGLDAEGLRLATERLIPLSKKVIDQTKNGLKVRKATERKMGDVARKVAQNYQDALMQIEVGAVETGGTLIGLSDQQYPSWGKWLRQIGEYHCFLNPEITEEEVIDAIVQDISPFMEGVDANQVRDALTGFGHNYKQSRYDAQRLMNSLRNISRSKRQIDWMDETNTMPPATGPIRDEPTQDEREWAKRVRDRKEEVPDAGRDERRLKSTLDTIKRNLENRIADLKRAIEIGERIPAPKRKVVDDIRVRELRAEKDEWQKRYDELFGTTKTLTPEQKIAMAEKTLNRMLEADLVDLDRARQGDFSKVEGRPAVTEQYIRRLERQAEKGYKTDSPALQALRERRIETLKAIFELKKAKYEFGMTPEEIEALNARKITNREKAVARLAERVATGDFRTGKPQPPMTPDQQKRYDELGEQMKRGRQKLAELRLEAENATVPTFVRKGVNFLRFVTTAQRALRATMDFSAVLRQAARMTLGHPVKAARAFGEAWTAARSEASLLDVNTEILSDPTVQEAVKKFGLHLREVDAQSDRDVEMFHGMERNKIKLFGKEYAITDIPLFGEFMLKSERHYLTYLNAMSADLYTSIVNGIPGGATPWQKKMIADMINIWNGSAALSERSRRALQDARMNDIFWAPQLAISRVQSAVGYDWWHPLVARGIKNADGAYEKPSREERVTAAKIGLREHFKATFAMFVFGALLKWLFSDDDDKYDFSQANWLEKMMMLASPKIGNTTIDLTGGESTFDRLVYHFATRSKRSGTGRLRKFGEFNGPDAWSLVGRYLQGKISPSVSTAFSLWNGKDFVGEEYGVGKMVREMLVPLTFDDVKDQLEQNGVGKSLVTVPLSILGAGGSTYDRKPYENAVNRFLEAKKEYDAIQSDDSVSGDERNQRLSVIREGNPLMRDDVRGKISAYIKGLRTMESTQKKAQKAGRPTDELNARIERRKAEILDMIRAARR